MQGLANPNLKTRRAKEHLDSLEVHCRSFVESKSYSVSSYEDFEAGQYVVKIQFQPPPLWPIGAIAGDFISNLRASLDNLIYGLVCINNQTPINNNCFPVIDIYRGQSTEDRFTNAVRGIPDSAKDIVRSKQPYNSGTSYKDTYLWKLDLLWNIDKHRHIPIDAAALDIHFPNIPNHFGPPNVALLDDTMVVRLPLAAKPYMQLNPVLGSFIRFGSEKEGLLATIEDFRGMYEYVTEKIIPRFSCYFPE